MNTFDTIVQLYGKLHSHKYIPFWVLTPIQDKDGKFNFVKLSLDDQRAVNYVKDYFRCLSSHLKSQELGDGRSWLDIYVQHVGDEPIKENIDSWEAIARIIKESAPDLKIIEAYRTPYFNQELIDIVIPQLDELEWPIYRDIPDKHQCWFYTCMYPRSNYANRSRPRSAASSAIIDYNYIRGIWIIALASWT